MLFGAADSTRDARNENNQRTASARAWARRGRRVDGGRAPGAAPFPGGRTGGLGTGGDTKKPERQTPLAGARSNPRSAPPADKFAAPSTHPALPTRAKFSVAGLGPPQWAGSSLPPPSPPARGPCPPSPPPLPLPPALLPLPQTALSRVHRGAGAPPPRSPAAGPARGEGAGWSLPGSAPHSPCSFDRAFCSVSHSPFRSSGRLGAQQNALRSSALGKLQTTPRAFPARRQPPSPALAARRDGLREMLTQNAG
ncbi:basic proline-rich protein-like [Eubalaena glacialis]|uniref:basic proline-rich protein-like n=1 Tax=Eubalaena glacialis TaxID=27606 RepID=UPI002A598D9D|nr:basic proline-rich protein-like [Eubalaena glacialis]